MLTEKLMTNIVQKKKKVNSAKYATIRLEGCGIIGMSEKKAVCFSSLSHIFLFFGFACDSGKKMYQFKKAGFVSCSTPGHFAGTSFSSENKT